MPLGGVARNAHDSQQDRACAGLVHARVFEHFVEMHVKQPGGIAAGAVMRWI